MLGQYILEAGETHGTITGVEFVVFADRTMTSKTGDESPGSVCSEVMDLPIHHTISSKQHHYNPHTLDNTMDFSSISHKHSDTVLKP